MVGIGRFSIERDLERQVCKLTPSKSHKHSARFRLWALRFAHLEQMETHPASWHAIPDARHRKRWIMHQRIRCRLLPLIRLFHNRIRSISTWNKHSYLPSLREKTSLRPFQNNFKHTILQPKLRMFFSWHKLRIQNRNFLRPQHFTEFKCKSRITW